ncbi:hypothetical protein F-M6_0110 [Faustovirus]|nr:hypothetical protein F-M6_0110 [Faustovirus]
MVNKSIRLEHNFTFEVIDLLHDMRCEVMITTTQQLLNIHHRDNVKIIASEIAKIFMHLIRVSDGTIASPDADKEITNICNLLTSGQLLASIQIDIRFRCFYQGSKFTINAVLYAFNNSDKNVVYNITDVTGEVCYNAKRWFMMCRDDKIMERGFLHHNIIFEKEVLRDVKPVSMGHISIARRHIQLV